MDEEKIIEEIRERYQMVLNTNAHREWIVRLYELEECTRFDHSGTNQKKCVYSNSGKALESVLLLAHSFALGK